MSKAKWKFVGQVLLGALWIVLCVWKLSANVMDGLARGFGAEVVVTSARRGTSHWPVWMWLLILGASIGIGVRCIYYCWLEYDEG